LITGTVGALIPAVSMSFQNKLSGGYTVAIDSDGDDLSSTSWEMIKSYVNTKCTDLNTWNDIYPFSNQQSYQEITDFFKANPCAMAHGGVMYASSDSQAEECIWGTITDSNDNDFLVTLYLRKPYLAQPIIRINVVTEQSRSLNAVSGDFADGKCLFGWSAAPDMPAENTNFNFDVQPEQNTIENIISVVQTYVSEECETTKDTVCAACTPCPPGQYAIQSCGIPFNNDRNDTKCALCPAGSYCPGVEGNGVDVQPNPCPDDALSAPGSDDISDCVCDPGFYRLDAVCVECPFDHYCPGTDRSITCPSSSFTHHQKSTARVDCHCFAGTQHLPHLDLRAPYLSRTASPLTSGPHI